VPRLDAEDLPRRGSDRIGQLGSLPAEPRLGRHDRELRADGWRSSRVHPTRCAA